MATTVESLEARVASATAALAAVERRVGEQCRGSLPDAIRARATLHAVLDGVSMAEIESMRETVQALVVRFETLRRVLEIVRR